MRSVFHIFYLFLLLSQLLFCCQEVVIVMDKFPENTPENSNIHIMGNFNYWDPGDPNFLLEPNSTDKYIIKMPKGKGEIKFKFTRGTLNTEETDICGGHMDNRSFKYGTADSLFITIESWTDTHPLNCPEDTTVIKIFPK